MSAWLGNLAIVIGTLLARSLLPVLGARARLTPRIESALRFAPGCALAAIVLPELLLQHGVLQLDPSNLRLPAAARVRAIPSPMPRPPPVTTATSPSRENSALGTG